MAAGIEPAVADKIAEIESAASKWTTNPWKKMSKSSTAVERSDLDLLYSTTQLAYETELTSIVGARQLHLALEKSWAKFAKASSNIQDVQLGSHDIKVRAALHAERVKILESYRNEDPAAMRVSMPLHPSMVFAIKGLSDLLVAKDVLSEREVASLLLREYEFPGQLLSAETRYTDKLPEDLPLQQYKIWMDGGLYGPPTYTVYMVSDGIKFKQHTVLMLRTAHLPGKFPQPVTHAYAWRPAEYPVPSMRIRSFGMSHTMGTVGLYSHIFGLQTPLTITEDPDVLGQFKWDTPRRFSFGGRRFVWKPIKTAGKRKFTPYKNFEVFEYTDIAPNPKDPNDVADDACFKSLFWTEEHGERIVCVGGLDPVLKEYLIAITVLRMAIRRYHIVSVAPEAEDESTVVAKMAGRMLAENGVALIQMLLGS
ncbi:hypothetical protein LIA77_01382 [Sarocladium implicatum]|nr:hypothetical protein LIA77_01382 [Sarocladium implicatum]